MIHNLNAHKLRHPTLLWPDLKGGFCLNVEIFRGFLELNFYVLSHYVSFFVPWLVNVFVPFIGPRIKLNLVRGDDSLDPLHAVRTIESKEKFIFLLCGNCNNFATPNEVVFLDAVSGK